MIDTIAATIEVDIKELRISAFGGESRSEDFGTGEVNARLYLNPRADRYAPRYTFWPVGSVLKVEVSLPKMINKDGENITAEEIVEAVALINADIQVNFGLVTNVFDWRCLRVDYVYNWAVEPSAEFFIKLYGGAEMGRMSRHDFGGDGVVWKQGNRWVKLYDKTAERGRSHLDDDSVLRLEVSNYKDAVRYMASRWFDCDASVREMTRVPRALFVLARYFRDLGMNHLPELKTVLLVDLRREFGSSAAQAFYAINCMNVFGRSAVKLGLMSDSSYYDWRRKLSDAGYLLTFGSADEHQMTHKGFSRVYLPAEQVFASFVKILDRVDPGGDVGVEQNFRKIFGLSESVDCGWLLDRFGRWLGSLREPA